MTNQIQPVENHEFAPTSMMLRNEKPLFSIGCIFSLSSKDRPFRKIVENVERGAPLTRQTQATDVFDFLKVPVARVRRVRCAPRLTFSTFLVVIVH